MTSGTSTSPLGTRAGESTLGPYVRAIRSHVLLCSLVILATLGGALAYTLGSASKYKASATLLVTPLPQDDQRFLGLDLLRDSGDPTRTVQTAATLIDSRAAASKTAAAIKHGYDADKVVKDVQVEPQGESNVVAVTATADSAGLAARLANEFASSALSLRGQSLRQQIDSDLASVRGQTNPTSEDRSRATSLQSLRDRGDPTLALSERATSPESPSGLGAIPVMIIALLAGAALATGLAVVLELTARRVRDEQEAVEIYPLPVLARVPEIPRRRRGPDGQTGWYMPPGVREAFRSLLVQLQSDPERRVIMVTSASTGDGKTTSAVNLAVSMVAAGHETTLVDFDIRKPDVARSMGIEVHRSLAHLVDPSITLQDILIEAPAIPSLSILAAGGSGPGDHALVEALGERLPKLLAEARAISEYVVIDTAPLGEISDALRIASAVDEVVLVTRPGSTMRANLQVTHDLLERAQVTPCGMLVVGVSPGPTSGYYSYGMHDQQRGLGLRGRKGS